MDNSYSESDVSLSPTQIFEKLDMLRQLQMMHRGKLLKQRLEYQNSPEISSSITEIVSHFSNSTTYNTFRSLLQSSQDGSNDATPCAVPQINSEGSSDLARLKLLDVIDGVSELNLSKEDSLPNTPVSRRSNPRLSNYEKPSPSKKISLDDMPILSPKKNFEELVKEKLKGDQAECITSEPKVIRQQKKQYLKRGEGMTRFGIRKNDLVIQNTNSLPWKKRNKSIKIQNVPKMAKKPTTSRKSKAKVQILDPVKVEMSQNIKDVPNCNEKNNQIQEKQSLLLTTEDSTNLHLNNIDKFNLKINSGKDKQQILSEKGKNWAAVLTKEQDDFLRQLKQSEYYKNFSSPTKTVDSDVSCCESVTQYKEIAEQNLFDLIEKKVSHESYSIENSFFNKFIRKSKLECSGESTPLVMQKCLSENPGLMHIGTSLNKRKEITCSEDDTCLSVCTDCSECCSVSSCCSCQTVTPMNKEPKKSKIIRKNEKVSQPTKEDTNKKAFQCQDTNDIQPDIAIVNANMVEMNAKLIATSDLLKERLRELEDEIETFRKENANITKMREEIDLERQKFYEEKAAHEQKFNEDKVLSEYYLAEEKEKLAKQKQVYERYVRDMRGRLNKKDKDEVVLLKKEISDLREEIRVKDAKSTSTIARLRNQLKIMEKDKKSLEEEVEKLKKQNKRIQHSNEVTRRLTNIKYLEQINKKLSNMTSRETKSEIDIDPDVKYKAFEIEKQSRPKTKGLRTRAKSVPNLNVTSKYAKYFSQKDALSDKVKSSIVTTHSYTADHETDTESVDEDIEIVSNIEENEDNYLERMYNDRFKSNSPSSKRSSTNLSDSNQNLREDTSGFFLQKSNSVSLNKKSLSPLHPTPNGSNSNISKSPDIYKQIKTNKDKSNSIQIRNKSPASVLSNHSSSHKPMTVIYKHISDDRLMPSPEPTTSVTKTSLNPVEYKKPNGSRELRFPNGNVKVISADGKYSKFVYYNGDIKENFYNEGRVKYFYAESKTYHTTHADGLEVLEFPDGQVEKRYKDASTEVRLPNGIVRYSDPKNTLVQEEWRYPDGTTLTISANGEQHLCFPNGQIEVHTEDHKRREFPDGTVKLVYKDGTSETRYASGRIRIKDKHGNLIMDSSRTNTY